MRDWKFLMPLLLGGILQAAPAPESVAVLFNASNQESRRLANFYCEQRQIPIANLIGLEMPDKPDVSREEYEKTIKEPLREEFERRGWWRRVEQADGNKMPVSNQIRVLVTTRGVPLRINRTRPVAGEAGEVKAPDPRNPFQGKDEASVDSELSLFGVDGLTNEGALDNKYFRSGKAISAVEMPFLLLTARLDGPNLETCMRMVGDAVAAEQTGLWGMAYVDIANKYPQGDRWLEAIAGLNQAYGIPTVVDRFQETLPRNYPMTMPAMYYGWYTWNLDGPFMNPAFRFPRGAVAVHIHSFSAEQLGDATKNWCAGLLAKGAAVTVGNVFEPYLGNTHDLGLLHQRLLEGNSWVEACWMAMPVCSWQGVVLGDPLYQPFLHLKGTGKITAENKPYRALRAAMLQWPSKERDRLKQLELAAQRTKKAVFLEAVGLHHAANDEESEAMFAFQKAAALYPTKSDQLRQHMHRVALDRTHGRQAMAIDELRKLTQQYGDIPEAQAAKVWLDLMQSPPKPEEKK